MPEHYGTKSATSPKETMRMLFPQSPMLAQTMQSSGSYQPGIQTIQPQANDLAMLLKTLRQ